jgi:hypothetical protein
VKKGECDESERGKDEKRMQEWKRTNAMAVWMGMGGEWQYWWGVCCTKLLNTH